MENSTFLLESVLAVLILIIINILFFFFYLFTLTHGYAWLILLWVQLTCALRVYINKSVFEKILSRIEKAVKTFSISDKTFSKNSIPLCALVKSFYLILSMNKGYLSKEKDSTCSVAFILTWSCQILTCFFILNGYKHVTSWVFHFKFYWLHHIMCLFLYLNFVRGKKKADMY